MPAKIIIQPGTRYSRLVVIKEAENRKGRRYLECLCDCGNIYNAMVKSLRNKHTRSCGCLRADAGRKQLTTHGMYGTRTYHIWSAIKQRCNDVSNPYYGERGITYSNKWETFEGFYKDMGECPENHQIDRINVNGNYGPDNCRWATQSTNSHNTRPHNKTGLKGVYPHYKGYQALIQRNGKQYALGTYKTTLEAAQAFDRKSVELYGNEACTNKSLGLI